MTKTPTTPATLLGNPPAARRRGTPCIIDRIQATHDQPTAAYVHTQMIERDPTGTYVWTAPDLAKRITERLGVECGTQAIRKHRINECNACRTRE